MRYRITPYGCATTLPDGREVPAAPEPTEDYAARARELGYGDDTMAMCREHEWLHVHLARLLLKGASPALLAAAGDDVDAALVGYEEAAVLAVQRFWCAASQ